jgi:hypothetical protein
MNDPRSLNIYSPEDLAADAVPAAERVFISHRLADKPLARAVAAVFRAQRLHYWFDEEDEDARRAAGLGMAGDQALVYSIERGIRHCSQILGLLSERTRGSWWVPYEIGFSRSQEIRASYLVLESIREMDQLPEYARLAANYWSVDELVRWAASLAGGHLQAEAGQLDPAVAAGLGRFVPRYAPGLSVPQLSARAISAIEQLLGPGTQSALQLTQASDFSWLPTGGGLIRDLAYDLYAPLAFYQLRSSALTGLERDTLQRIYRSITRDYELAALPPAVEYQPEAYGWRRRRYAEPASSWKQGLALDKLRERLGRFFIVLDLDGRQRLATKEEFKAEFDRILASGTENEQRSLGVLVNPLFGFTPRDRPVYLRVLALQYLLYGQLADGPPRPVFSETLMHQVRRLAEE